MALLPTITLDPQSSAEVAIAAAVNSLQAQGGGIVALKKGTFTFSAPLMIAPTAPIQLIGAGRDYTTITVSYTPDASRADDPTNYIMSFAGAPLGSSTTTTDVIYRGTTINIPVANSAILALSPGDEIEIAGFNGTSEYYLSQEITVANREVCRVASVPDGTHITLTAAVRIHHISGSVVRKVFTISHVKVQDLAINGSGHNIAVGLNFSYAHDVEVSGLTVQGFSRTTVAMMNCTESWKLHDSHSLGEINGFIHADAAHGGEVYNLTSAADGLRNHALGVPRGLIYTRNDPDLLEVHDCEFSHGTTGCWFRHGHNLSLSRVKFRDFDPRPAFVALVAANEKGGMIAVVETGGTFVSPPFGDAQFLQNIIWDKIHVIDCVIDSDAQGGAPAAAFYFHDATGKVTDCSIVNQGGSNFLQGFHSQDAIGWIKDLLVNGHNYGLSLHGVYVPNIDGYIYNPVSGSGASHSIGIAFDIGQAPPTFSRVQNDMMRFVGGIGTPPELRIQNVLINGRHYDVIQPIVNKSGVAATTTGQAMEIDNTASPARPGILQFKTPTAATQKVVLVVNTPWDPSNDGDTLFGAVLPQRCQALLDATAGVPGDLVEITTAKRLHVNNATTKPVGKLLDVHTAAEGVAWIGPL